MMAHVVSERDGTGRLAARQRVEPSRIGRVTTRIKITVMASSRERI